METIDMSKAYTVRGYRGIAFRIIGPETVANEDTEWTGIEEETGNYIAVMVGDDREHVVSPDDLLPLDDGDFCGECGQVGCHHG